ncbi:MAG: iron-containing alcohol dehydrogenase [Methanoregula sp.]|uniref:alcohol dehydrogenase-like regulatory protein ErcA n=1 Tax=Methanoregula sp. TaxID=2052170 RepID=UPI0025E3877D|nr:alcohol dehydrogenase-like regulatory protein ErcA [Methanoregula sp.]MCK9632138.1 iron-containing alcohol dehydrogenase [Methanoregula sp.]
MTGDRFELRKFVAPEFVIGSDARLLTGRYAKNFGARHVLVVTGPNIIREGWVRDVTASLNEEGIAHTVFSSVSPNPRDTEVMAGAAIYAESGCDSIVAVGGGSPMDCAKGIGIVSSNTKNILEFEGVDRIAVPPPPVICIPTTAGTGADVSQFAIINDTNRRVKIAIISKKIVPDIALIDPLPLTTLTPELTAYTGMDAITHSVEAYVSNASSPVTDIHALESIRLMQAHLLPACKNPKNTGHRYQTMLGSLCAGLAFSNASLGAVHAMAHSLGGFSDLPHGECNALLLEHVMAFNFPSCPGRYEAIGHAMGADLSGLHSNERKEKVIAGIRSLRETLGITETLGDLGVTKEKIPTLARNALQDPCMATNPRQPTAHDIERIYEEAL